MIFDLSGTWQADIGDGKRYPMQLPGTLDENRIGGKDTGSNLWHPDENGADAAARGGRPGVIATRFTRNCTWEGEARISRRVSFAVPDGKRVFLEAERARALRVLVDGGQAPRFAEGRRLDGADCMEVLGLTDAAADRRARLRAAMEAGAAQWGTLSAPQVFELTGLLSGENEITLCSSNHYEGLPREDIVSSSAATDETQTNWNGVLGFLRLRVEEPVFLSDLRAYPKGDTLTVEAEISADQPFEGALTICSDALTEEQRAQVSVPAGSTVITLEKLSLRENVRRWDEEEGNLCELTAELESGSRKTVTFGVRDFGDDGFGHLALNGRRIFLRCEANCAEFPETGHAPMTVSEWTEILRIYRGYGVNCLRFHSHCPPDAAFTAADQMGMLMQPELSCWNPKNAFETDESDAYYQAEFRQLLRALANHPSFVMLTLGNELHAGAVGHERMSAMLRAAKKLDDTRLYANGSNVHYGAIGCDPDSDFYASQKYIRDALRGTFAGVKAESLPPLADTSKVFAERTLVRDGIQGYINQCYPDAKTNYDETMDRLRETYQKPVFSFEVGQFEVLPDFEELKDFHGISDPANLRLIQERARERGLEKEWKTCVEATGEMSRLAYREEIEAALRTKDFSGISLLGLQDFPGQGTALVGMLNSHLQPKPYDFAKPGRFREFFCAQLPLAELERYTYEAGETLYAAVKAANYGKTELAGPVRWTLSGDAWSCEGTLGDETVKASVGGVSLLGMLGIELPRTERPVKLTLTVMIGEAVNTYPIWVYPQEKPVRPEGVYETERLDEAALAVLREGGTVYLTPQSTPAALPRSIRAQFTTDFWSVGTFPAQEGAMGQLIDAKHPLFADFPTEFYTNWQWWPMAVQRAVILPHRISAIVTELDSYAALRPMAQLFECRCGGGRLLFSSFGLQDLQVYPEARALLRAIYRYLASEKFAPEQELSAEEIQELVR